jgi:phenylpyruvate tautomerase PptA (4-oxalocrotonate tautomerase family)
MARSPRSLDELKTSIEESMADALHQHGQQDIEPASNETAPALDMREAESRSDADRLVHACNMTAAEIQGTGEAVVQVANSIAAETQALAELLRKHGAAIAVRIEEFAAMSKRVADKVQAARDDVLSASGTAPSLAPQLERDERK